jgi:outer membrane protein assembly factor BamE (lipoprotein component of BamABCDE complex)
MPQRPSDTPPEMSRPYFHMSDQEKRNLVDSVKKVRLGDKRQQVEALLGKPFEDYLVRRKENNKPMGRFVKYYVLKLSKTSANSKYDQDVLFRFDTDDRLEEIISHVSGIENRP